MKILILGAGKMGSFFADVLSFQHEVALFDTDPKRLRFVFNTYRMTALEEVKEFQPELVINAATVKYTIAAFEMILPHIPANCIISDIASVKTGLPEFYQKAGHPFVSTHPMFGPTFANLSDLSTQNTIIISESDHLGKVFFKDLYSNLRLRIFEYSFKEHDETIAYSLSIPFASTLVFAAVMRTLRVQHSKSTWILLTDFFPKMIIFSRRFYLTRTRPNKCRKFKNNWIYCSTL